MAEAPIQPDLFAFYVILLPIMLVLLLSRVSVLLHQVDCLTACKSSRVRYHRGHRPKHQYRYHWFKERMKHKRKRRLKNPKPPLYYLTFCGCAFIATFKVAILLHRILITISDICIYLGTKSCHFMSWFSNCSVHQAYFYHIAYPATGEDIDQVTHIVD